MARNGLPKLKGFTLIELMIVIVIVAILAGIALPAYQNQIRKTKRSVGKGTLLKVAAAQEQFFVNNKQYAGDLLNLGYDEATDGFEVDSEAQVVLDDSSDAIYLITLSTTTNAYALQAAPRNGQTKDKFCQTLTLSSTGEKGVTGSPSPQWTAKECW